MRTTAIAAAMYNYKITEMIEMMIGMMIAQVIVIVMFS